MDEESCMSKKISVYLTDEQYQHIRFESKYFKQSISKIIKEYIDSEMHHHFDERPYPLNGENTNV
jgi:hypothetical protein